MDSVYLFNLASVQRHWLATRQALVAQNIANANTPGYKAVDTPSFSKVMDAASRLELSGPHPMHFQAASATNAGERGSRKDNDMWETVHSGNSVALEAEMIEGSEIKEAFSLNTNIVRTFHGMWMASLKG